MSAERLSGGTCGPPFPVYENLAAGLLAAHAANADGRSAMVAHVLATAAGYSYAGIDTMATMMSRLGLENSACVRISQTVDAMLIFSTAYLIQSRCGRVVILCYRGTEPSSLGNWLGDADVGSESIALGAQTVGVHSGFYRNVRATRWAVMRELDLAAQGRSLLNADERLEHRMEAFYVTGHSLGGAMAVLFALSLASGPEPGALAAKLRAVYTFGQPLVAGDPLPDAVRDVGRKVFRHVMARDLIPTLPAAAWGKFAHFGHEYRYRNGQWQLAETPVAQLANLREIPRSLLAFFATAKHRDSARYSMADHGPHHYISALRPLGRITEFGDQG